MHPKEGGGKAKKHKLKERNWQIIYINKYLIMYWCPSVQSNGDNHTSYTLLITISEYGQTNSTRKFPPNYALVTWLSLHCHLPFSASQPVVNKSALSKRASIVRECHGIFRHSYETPRAVLTRSLALIRNKLAQIVPAVHEVDRNSSLSRAPTTQQSILYKDNPCSLF